MNLDIGSIEAARFVEEIEPDVDPLGVDGLGELALTGPVPTIANVVLHATGRRVRELPIRLDALP